MGFKEKIFRLRERINLLCELFAMDKHLASYDWYDAWFGCLGNLVFSNLLDRFLIIPLLFVYCFGLLSCYIYIKAIVILLSLQWFDLVSKNYCLEGRTLDQHEPWRTILPDYIHFLYFIHFFIQCIETGCHKETFALWYDIICHQFSSTKQLTGYFPNHYWLVLSLHYQALWLTDFAFEWLLSVFGPVL